MLFEVLNGFALFIFYMVVRLTVNWKLVIDRLIRIVKRDVQTRLGISMLFCLDEFDGTYALLSILESLVVTRMC